MASLVGQPAPSLRLPDAEGRLVGLDELRGRPIVLVFTRHVH